MIDALQYLIAFMVALGVLITFHEFGHYLVARFFNVKILKFSIGFGKSIYKKTIGADKTEFILAYLPLGGYVKMLDKREGKVEKEELHREFNNKKLWQRFCIVSAGPVFNLVFAVLAYWVVFMVGITGMRPIIGSIEQDSLSAKSGLIAGQEIVSVNGELTPTWSTAAEKIINNTINSDSIAFTVKNREDEVYDIKMDVSNISVDDIADGDLMGLLGVSPFELKLPAIIGKIVSHSPADNSGLVLYDEIISLDNIPINSWGEFVQLIRKNPEKTLHLGVKREGEYVGIWLTPEVIDSDNGKIGRIGAAVSRPEGLFDDYFIKESYPFFTALKKSIDKTLEMSLLILKVIGKMLTGEASIKNLSGPVSIAKYAGQSAEIGFLTFLSFMAMISISLGVLNLLPIPLLDGGHLMYYFIEFVTGKPVSESIQIYGQQFGLFFLVCLMGIAIYNDFVRLLG